MLQGVEDLATPEMQKCIMEIVRRDASKWDALINAIRDQLPVDTDILPQMNSGESEASTESIATDKELEDAKIFNMVWDS
jgi:hypothetical protein